MKKIILSSLFLYSLLYCAGVSATTYYGPGSSGNPINVQIVQTFSQQVDALKARYSLTDFQACESQNPLYKSGTSNDPSTQSLKLMAIKSCLEMTVLYRERNKSNDSVDDIVCSGSYPNTVVVISDGKKMCECKTGYGWNEQKTGCIVADLVCSRAYSNSVSIIVDGKTKCGCKSGYVWNDAGTSCIITSVVPVKTNNQICQDRYGQEGMWNGNFLYSDVPDCECRTGYALSQKTGSCVIVPVVPAKSNDQICQDSYGINSNWDGTKNDKGGLVCDCKTGYQWNEGQTQCVVIPETETSILIRNKVLEAKNLQNFVIPKAEMGLISDTNSDIKVVAGDTGVVKQKSFWARISGWFGF
jgi:hypothetical protein